MSIARLAAHWRLYENSKKLQLAFGQEISPSALQPTGMRCLALPTWDRLDDVLGVLVEMGKDSPGWTFQK